MSTTSANTQNGVAEYAPDEKEKYIMESIDRRFPINLQFFAEPANPAAGAEAADPAADPANPADPANTEEQAKIPQFSELLKNKDFLASLDQHTTKATATAVENAVKKAQQKWEADAKLTEEEREKNRKAEAEAALTEREHKLASRELRADMVVALAEKGLPAELIDSISMTDKDAAAASLDAVEKSFRSAVKAGVEAKLKGTSPTDPGNTGGAVAGTVEDAIKQKMYPNT